MTVRSEKLGKLVKERGLQTTGFRRAILGLVKEFSSSDGDDLRYEFSEWFGYPRVIPAAFSIERGKRDGLLGVTIHVYELEISSQIPSWKFQQYSWMADGDGPLVCLHIIDRHGAEDIIDQEDLEQLWSKRCDRTVLAAVAEIRRDYRKACEVPSKPMIRKWKAAYDAVREMGVKI